MKPISDSKILFWLSLPFISVRKQAELLLRFGSPAALWSEFEANASIISEGVGEKAFSELRRYHNVEFIDQCLEKLHADGITVVTALNPLYPPLWRQPEVTAPLVVYCRGDIGLLPSTCVAMVGTRACTPYGRDAAKGIARRLAENGVTVVSGLATGIDAYSHMGALDGGGKTIAVLGSGLNKMTPVTNVALYEKILAGGGLVLSEYKPNADASKFTFPERNRLISGLSRGTAVIEAGEKSGALITANFALEQNREVFALPGNVDSTRSKGCNALIHDGALLIRDGDDILEYLKLPCKKIENAEIVLDKEQKKLYSLLKEGEKTFDELVEASGMSPAELSATLTDMELDRIVARRGDNTFVLAEGGRT